MGFLERAIQKGIRKGVGDGVAIALLPIAAGALLALALHKHVDKVSGAERSERRARAEKPERSEKVQPPVPEEAVQEQKQIVVMTRYSDADIDRLILILPNVALLTHRELEVLREIMRGRKQSEVAHYLGIEVSTVKDFYKKIYTKLDVSNKDGLFLKVSELLQA